MKYREGWDISLSGFLLFALILLSYAESEHRTGTELLVPSYSAAPEVPKPDEVVLDYCVGDGSNMYKQWEGEWTAIAVREFDRPTSKLIWRRPELNLLVFGFGPDYIFHVDGKVERGFVGEAEWWQGIFGITASEFVIAFPWGDRTVVEMGTWIASDTTLILMTKNEVYKILERIDR